MKGLRIELDFVLTTEIYLQQQVEFTDQIHFIYREMPVCIGLLFCDPGDIDDEPFQQGAQHFSLHFVPYLHIFYTLRLYKRNASFLVG